MIRRPSSSFQEGENLFTITAVDEAGNQAQLSFRVYYLPDLATKEDVSSSQQNLSQQISSQSQGIHNSINQMGSGIKSYVNQTFSGIVDKISAKIEALGSRLAKTNIIAIVTLIIAIIVLVVVLVKK